MTKDQLVMHVVEYGSSNKRHQLGVWISIIIHVTNSGRKLIRNSPFPIAADKTKKLQTQKCLPFIPAPKGAALNQLYSFRI